MSGAAAAETADAAPAQKPDMLTPAYYAPGSENALKAEVDRFVSHSRKDLFHHPLQNESGEMPAYKVHDWGSFGAGKRPWREV